MSTRIRTRISPSKAKMRVMKLRPETSDVFPCGCGRYALGVMLRRHEDPIRRIGESRRENRMGRA